jgi:hypothetical protein
MTDDRKTALNLAHNNGWSLFPLAPNSKKPPQRFRWRDESTNNPNEWRTWFAADDANIGLDCGKSGLVVVDIDPRAGGVVSVLNLARSELMLRPTLMQHTRGDGLHLIYQAHLNHELSNTAGRLPGVGELAGIDLRANGGYIVYATSTVDGRPWRLINPQQPVALAPSWMTEPDTEQPAHVVQASPERIRTSYIEAALRDEAAQVAGAAKGTRNHTLNSAAFSLGQLIGHAGLTTADVTNVLAAAATACGLPERDAQSAIRSGIKGAAAKPRTATP